MTNVKKTDGGSSSIAPPPESEGVPSSPLARHTSVDGDQFFDAEEGGQVAGGITTAGPSPVVPVQQVDRAATIRSSNTPPAFPDSRRGSQEGQASVERTREWMTSPNFAQITTAYNEAGFHHIFGEVVDQKSFEDAKHIVNIAQAYRFHGFESVLWPISDIKSLASAEQLVQQSENFKKAAQAINGVAMHFIATLARNRSPKAASAAAMAVGSSVIDASVKGVFPAEFEIRGQGQAVWRKGDTVDLGGERFIYLQWHDHSGVMRTKVPPSGTVTADTISARKNALQGSARKFLRHFTPTRTVKVPLGLIKTWDANGRASRSFDWRYNAHYAPLYADTAGAMLHYHRKEYDAFLKAVVDGLHVVSDLMDTFKNGPIFSETMIKTLFRMASAIEDTDRDRYDKYRHIAMAFAHYIRNLSVRQNKTVGHPRHGLWANERIHTNPAYVHLEKTEGPQEGLQRTIDAILKESPYDSAMKNIRSAAVRAAIVGSAMVYCAERADYENDIHLRNVSEGIGAAVSIIGGALNAAPFVAVGSVFAGLADPLQSAIVSHETSKFRNNALTELATRKMGELKHDAEEGLAIPGLANAGTSRERKDLGTEFVKALNGLERPLKLI